MKNTKTIILFSLISILGFFYCPVLTAEGEDPEIEVDNGSAQQVAGTPATTPSPITTTSSPATQTSSAPEVKVTDVPSKEAQDDPEIEIEKPVQPPTGAQTPPVIVEPVKPATPVTPTTPAATKPGAPAPIKKAPRSQATLDPLQLSRLKAAQAAYSRSRATKSPDGKPTKSRSLGDWQKRKALLRSKKPAAIPKSALIKKVYESKGKEKFMRERFVAGRTVAPIKPAAKKAAATTPPKIHKQKFAQPAQKPKPTVRKPKKPKTPTTPAAKPAAPTTTATTPVVPAAAAAQAAPVAPATTPEPAATEAAAQEIEISAD